MSALPDECAQELLEVVPLVMRAIRAEMRSHRSPDISVSQFRTLLFLSRKPGVSLSAVADHIGLTLPSMSKMIDGLVARRLVKRREDPADRRRVTLSLTREGKAMGEAARAAAQSALADRLSELGAGHRTKVVQAMNVLRPIFAAARKVEVAR